MRLSILTFILIIFSMTKKIQAQDNSDFSEYSEGKVVCDEEIKDIDGKLINVPVCIYALKNHGASRAWDLVRRVNQAYAGGSRFIGARDFIEVVPGNNKLIHFWIADPIIHYTVKEKLPLWDTLPWTGMPLQVSVIARVYTLTSSAERNVSFQLGKALEKMVGDTNLSIDFEANTNVYKFDFPGSIINDLLGSYVGRGEIEEIETINASQANENNLSASINTPIFVSANDLNLEKLEAGLSLSGRVSVREFEKKPVINITNFSLEHGVLLPKKDVTDLEKVTTISFSNAEFYLLPGHTKVAFQVVNDLTVNSKSLSVLNWGKANSSFGRKVLITVSGSVDKAISHNNNDFIPVKNSMTFSADEIAAFRSAPVSFDELLKAVYLKTRYAWGERVLEIYFDPELATKTNYQRVVTIEMSAKGWKQIVTTTIEDLMLNGLLLKAFTPALLNSSHFNIDVKFKSVDSGKKLKGSLKLLYLPSLNRLSVLAK